MPIVETSSDTQQLFDTCEVEVAGGATRALFPDFGALWRELAFRSTVLCQHIQHPNDHVVSVAEPTDLVLEDDQDMARITSKLVAFSKPQQLKRSIWWGVWIGVNVAVALGVLVWLATL